MICYITLKVLKLFTDCLICFLRWGEECCENGIANSSQFGRARSAMAFLLVKFSQHPLEPTAWIRCSYVQIHRTFSYNLVFHLQFHSHVTVFYPFLLHPPIQQICFVMCVPAASVDYVLLELDKFTVMVKCSTFPRIQAH